MVSIEFSSHIFMFLIVIVICIFGLFYSDILPIGSFDLIYFVFIVFSQFFCTAFVWKYLLCTIMSYTCFEPGHFLYSYHKQHTSYIVEVGKHFKLLNHDVVWAENQTVPQAATIYATVSYIWTVYTYPPPSHRSNYR